MESHGQGIVGKKSACKEITFSDNVLDGFHCLKASDHTSHSSDNTSLFAGWYCVLRRRIFEYTSVAWTFSWYVGHQLSFKTDNTCMRKRFLCHNAGIVDQEFCREVVCSINDKIIIFDNIHDIFGSNKFTICIDFYIRVDGLHGFFG